MASSASTEQCSFCGGRPSSSSTTCLLVILRASSSVLPLIISVAVEEVAMAAAHPNVLNFASVMTSLSILRVIYMMSPQVALPTVPIAS